MDPIRIACVQYLNTTPLIEGLDRVQGVELISTAPARIGDLVRDGSADLGLASLIDAARSPLVLVPAGMIGCDGPTLTVCLWSRIPIGAIRRVCVDSESHTSAALCSVVLSRLHSICPEMVAFDAGSSDRRAWPETVLLIGDKVVRGAPPESSHPHRLDLGRAWKDLTGLPFVYAMWMCRPEAVGTDRIRVAATILDRQRRRNAMRLDWIAARRGPEHGFDAGLARRYLGSLLRYEVGPREREAVAAFFTEAGKLGLAPRSEPTWADASLVA